LQEEELAWLQEGSDSAEHTEMPSWAAQGLGCSWVAPSQGAAGDPVPGMSAGAVTAAGGSSRDSA